MSSGGLSRHTTRCGQFIESQYYTFGSSTSGRKVNVKICCFCCNDKDLVSVDQIKAKFDCGGQTPLPLCEYCLGQSIKPPLVRASTNFAEKEKQKQATKKRQLDEMESRGLRKGRGGKTKK